MPAVLLPLGSRSFSYVASDPSSMLHPLSRPIPRIPSTSGCLDAAVPDWDPVTKLLYHRRPCRVHRQMRMRLYIPHYHSYASVHLTNHLHVYTIILAYRIHLNRFRDHRVTVARDSKQNLESKTPLGSQSTQSTQRYSLPTCPFYRGWCPLHV
jgi:hypothetical protein